MKKIILLFSIILFIGCNEFSNRKDLSQNIVFENSIPRGTYNFNLISLDYPSSYSKKIDFYNELHTTLSSLNDAQKNAINLLIDDKINTDFSSLINIGWIDNEIIGMKIVEDLTLDDKNILNTINIATPSNAGNLQALLNKQYYILLELTNNESLYNPEYLYTELDKNILLEDIVIARKSLIENLKFLQRNFVYISTLNKENVPIFINNDDVNLDFYNKNPMIFEKSNIYSGFNVLPNNLVIYIGNGAKNLSTEDYKFKAEIIKLSSPNLLRNNNLYSNSVGVSRFFNWKRKEWKKRDDTSNLETKFSILEVN